MTETRAMSFMASDHENYSDLDELFGDKPRTRSVIDDISTCTVATNKRIREMKRKAQTSCSASAHPQR